MELKIGSLFDGSGGFPFAASLCGIKPTWASEVEPYPIAVTRSRFPGMKHLGSVTDINGGEIEPVDIITFGSPCQDLSVAGKRAGLKHEANGDEETTRSGLFMEAVRIIKEMREATDGKYPTFALWENVPGAFSSNKGEDFRIVLEELIKIVEPSAVMPAVPSKGWPYADSYCGDGWSLAYRVFDAQHWGKTIIDRDSGTVLQMGTPQRRRRIHLILDLRGERAKKVLFEREGLRGDFAESGAPWQGTARDAQSGVGTDDREGERVVYRTVPDLVLDDQGGSSINVRTDGKSPTLRAEMHGNVPCIVAAGFKAGQSKAGGIGWQEECAATLSAQCSGTEPTVCVKTYDARGNGDGKTVSTLTGDHQNRVTDYTSLVVEPAVYDGSSVTSPVNASNSQPGDPCHTLSTDSRNYVVIPEPVFCLQGNGIDRADTAGCNGKGWTADIAYTLNTIDRPAVAYTVSKASFFTRAEEGIASTLVATDYKDPQLVAYTEEQPIAFAVDCRNLTEQPELYQTLQAKPNGGQSLNFSGAVRVSYIVRRLTPTECARLQGFPDKWGHPDPKEDFTDEEYRFWLEVRNTHAAINGKAVKEYTKEQKLKWYNKLHTDSAEYKMWGNGIALHPALYCMQGMAEALTYRS